MAFTTTMLSWSVLEFGGLMKGDATKDHACWERPADMDTPRKVIKIDRNTPGTEVAAETAAALASAFWFSESLTELTLSTYLKGLLVCLSLLISIEAPTAMG